MFFAHVKLRNNNWRATNYSSKNIMVPAIFSRRAFERPCYDESLNSIVSTILIMIFPDKERARMKGVSSEGGK